MAKKSVLIAAQIALVTEINDRLTSVLTTERTLADSHQKQNARLNDAGNNHTMSNVGGRVVSTDPKINAGISEIGELDQAHIKAVSELDQSLSKIIADKEVFFTPLRAAFERETSEARMIEAAENACMDGSMHPINRAKKLLAALSAFAE